jgi:hypothetical protein
MWDPTTWRKEILSEMENHSESFSDVIGMTLSEQELDEVFDAGPGGHEGKAFTVWTETRVYFPVVYDGKEWAGSAPRHPCSEATKHVGGE